MILSSSSNANVNPLTVVDVAQPPPDPGADRSMFLWMSQSISVNWLGVIVTELSVDVYVRSGAEISIFQEFVP